MRIWRGVGAAAVAVVLAACGGGGAGNRLTGSSLPPGVIYQGPQFTASQLTLHADRAYSKRANPDRLNYTDEATKASELRDATLTLKMDVWVPPNATASKPQPLIITLHGGSFTSGSKTNDVESFPISYARAGYVAAAVNYRLTQDPDLSPERRLWAQMIALEDLQNAIRYLRANAATYHIDPTRIATIGSSAGGALSLANAVQANDPPLDGFVSDYPGVSAGVAAAASTGATLIDPLVPGSTGLLVFDAGDAPALLFHAQPTDPFTGATWTDNVLPTCKLMTDAGASCEAVATPGSMHTVVLGVQANQFWDDLFPFLKQRLRLAELTP